MRHKWVVCPKSIEEFMSPPKRICARCRAIQVFEITGYDRLSNPHTIYRWTPPAGKCRTNQRRNNEPKDLDHLP